MPTTRRPVKAWVLYWSDFYMYGQKAEKALDGEVVAVLPIQWGRKPVCAVLERLFAERCYTPSELITFRHSGPHLIETHKVRLHDDATTDNYLNRHVIGYSIGHNLRLLARRAEHVRVVESPWEIAWKETGPVHNTMVCAELGVPNCNRAGEPNFVVDMSWRRPELMDTYITVVNHRLISGAVALPVAMAICASVQCRRHPANRAGRLPLLLGHIRRGRW